MAAFSLLNLETLLRKIGRGVVFYAVDLSGDPTRWDAASELTMTHLGDTEGDIVFEPNGTVANLTLPELSGDAIHESTHLGENPQLQMPLFLADPDLIPILSPTGQAGSGYGRVRDVAERTLVVFPERLFQETDATFADLAFSAGTWTVGGDPLTASQQTSLENSIWLWRGYFERPSRSYYGGHGDDGKNIETVAFNAMMHPDLPEGQRLFTLGDPSAVAIDIETGVS